jgi:hypothetical protein
MEKNSKTFRDTVMYVFYLMALSGFAAFMAVLIYFLRLLGVK